MGDKAVADALKLAKQLLDVFNEWGEVEVTVKGLLLVQPLILDELAPGDGFKVERTPRGFIISKW